MSAKSNFRKTPEEFADEIKKVLSANVSKSIQLMTRANNLIKDTVQNFSTADRKSAAKESDILERWLNFNVATYTVINDHALSLLEKLITVAEESISGNPPKKNAENKAVDISISGRPGEKQSTYFLIQNHYDHPLEISFEASPFVAENVPVLPNTHITFDPSSATLKENEQRTIKVDVDITKQFVPGTTYTTNIHVSGFEAKELILSITVLQPVTPKSQTTASKASSGKTKTGVSGGKKRPGRSGKTTNRAI